jgi:hypothetical protein
MQPPPPLHTMFIPQTVPPALSVPSAHTGEPVIQETTPFLHGLGLVPHAAPAAHVLHTPELHTRLVPHGVPLALFAPSLHTGLPVEQVSVPCLHGDGFVEQADPGVHGLHAPPPLQTPLGQAVPAAFGVVLFTHTG